MKHLKLAFLFSFAAFIFTSTAKSQTIQDVLSDKNIDITFYGIDFTKALLIGDATAKTDEIVARQYANINDLMINESKKYDIAGAFKRIEIPANLEIVKSRNEKINPNAILSANTTDYNHLTEADIVTLIKGFKPQSKEGLGLLFVVDAMSKAQSRISAWAVLFDNKSKKIILNERHEGKVGMAFGFRNYWAAGLKNIILSIAEKNKNR